MKVYLVRAKYFRLASGHRSELLRIYATLADARNWILSHTVTPFGDPPQSCRIKACPDDPRYFAVVLDPPTGNRYTDAIGSIEIFEEELHGSPLVMLAAQAE